MALKPVYRSPPMTGPQVEYRYMVDTVTRQRTPAAFRTLPSQGWITDEALVAEAFAALHARNAAYAKAQAALGPMFVDDENGAPQGAARIDNGEVVSLLLPAERQPEKWLEVAVAVVEAAPDETLAGTLAVVWVS